LLPHTPSRCDCSRCFAVLTTQPGGGCEDKNMLYQDKQQVDLFNVE
jgi:hypothetical protein